MWSNNEHINSSVNILLFLLAINFLHIGQLLLPIICLILFVDNNYKFKVNNIETFVLLCLFGISFLCFSYKTGFYSTMGLCLPMAYYIGSNIKRTDETSIKNIIYIFALGMASHILLNFIFEIFVDGTNLFNSVNHYDVWTGGYVPTTSTATNFIFIISLIYYLVFREKNKKIQIMGIILFCVVLFYDLALGRRTPLLLLALCLLISIIIDVFISKNKKMNYKAIFRTVLVILFFIVFILLIYGLNLFNAKEFINNLGLIKKLNEYGLDTGRIDIFIDALKLMPSHLWGNQEIHDILGIQIHDLWFDTFDYAGIIPFILMVLRSIISLSVLLKLLKTKNITKDFKMFVVVLFVAITVQLFLEPIMSGSSLFIIIVVLIEAMLENKLIYENE